MEEQGNLTELFLKNIHENFPNMCFRRLPDSAEERKKKGGAYFIEEKDIEKYNGDATKMGIFFTPNGDYLLNPTSRVKENAKNVYAFVVDRDTNKDFFWENFPYEPSFVTETHRGFHAFRLLDEPFEYQKSFGADLKSPKTFDVIEGFLCDHFGGDHGAKDIARIFRLPGTRYWKDNLGETIIKTILYKPENKYSLQDFLTLHASTGRIVRENERVKKEIGNTGYDLVEDINRLVDVGDVLYDLGGGKWEIKSNGDITENGALTDGYKFNKRENYLNSFSANERPEGGPYAVAKFFLRTASDVFKYFREKHNIGEIKKTEQLNISKETEIDAKTGEEIITRIKIPTSKEDIIIDYISGETLIINGNEEKKLLDGILEPKGFYKNGQNINVYIVYYKNLNGNDGYIEMQELGRPSLFERICSEVGITFFGSKATLKTIISYIHGAKEQYTFIDKLGLLTDGTIVNKAGKYIFEKEFKKYFVNIAGFTLTEGLEVLKIGEHNDLATVKNTIAKLKEHYDDKVICTLFTSFAMSLFTKYIRENIGFYPATVLVGLSQSGKTYNRKLMMKIFGLDKSLEIQASTTEFIAMRRGRHYLPMCVAEFKNEDIRFNRDVLFKNNFDGTLNERGTANQTAEGYEANSPLFIDGETRSMTSSVFSRSISLFMNPLYRKSPQRGFKNINKYFTDNFENIYGIIMSYDEAIDRLTEITKDIDKQEKSRIVETYSLMLAFAECFGFLEDVEEQIIGQMKTQFMMMGEDSVDKVIKLVMGLATSNNFICDFDDVANTFKIDFLVDELKFNTSKIRDIEAAIQLANHHFSGGKIQNTNDVLHIPIEHIFETKDLHNSFNRILNKLISHTEVSRNMAKKILQYGRDHQYTKQYFWTFLSTLPEFQRDNFYSDNNIIHETKKESTAKDSGLSSDTEDDR